MHQPEPIPVDPLSYHVVAPRSPAAGFAATIARVLAIGSILYSLNPLLGLLQVALHLNVQSPWGYVDESQAAWVRIAVAWAPWLTGAAAIPVCIGAIGTVLGRETFRRLLVWGMMLIIIPVLGMSAVALWDSTHSAAPVFGAGFTIQTQAQAMLSLLSMTFAGVESILFPVTVIVILTRPTFVALFRMEEATTLSTTARMLCVLAIVAACIGLASRPMGLLLHGTEDSPLNQVHPLGLPTVQDAVLTVWNGITRLILWICCAVMLIGAILLLQGKPAGRRLLLWQAIIATIVNGTDVISTLIVFSKLSISIESVAMHAAIIVPPLILDLAIWFYFRRASVVNAIYGNVAPPLSAPPPTAAMPL